jgi:hypothetical protein
MPGPFDRFRELPLMRGTDSADAAGKDLSAFRNEVPKELSVLKVDVCDFLRAELANPFAAN